MLIAKAYAADGTPQMDATMKTGTVTPPGGAAANMPEAPSPMEAFMWNMGLILLLVVMFYVLLIMPQQRRFKEHGIMLSGLKKGDKVVTGGGFIGTIDKIVSDTEILVDLGGGVKVTALRSSLQGRNDPHLKSAPANDQKTQAKG